MCCVFADDRRTLRVANELHHAFPQFTQAQICEVVDREITADAAAIKLLEMDARRGGAAKITQPSAVPPQPISEPSVSTPAVKQEVGSSADVLAPADDVAKEIAEPASADSAALPDNGNFINSTIHVVTLLLELSSFLNINTRVKFYFLDE